MCVIGIHVCQCREDTQKLLQRPMQISSSPPPLRLLLTLTLLAYPGWPVGVPLHFSENQVSRLEVVWHCPAPLCSLDLKSIQLRILSVSLFVCFFFRSTRNLETMGLASKLTVHQRYREKRPPSEVSHKTEHTSGDRSVYAFKIKHFLLDVREIK